MKNVHKAIFRISLLYLSVLIILIYYYNLYQDKKPEYLFPYPSSAINVKNLNRTCASAACSYYATYDFPGEDVLLLNFYHENNYKCREMIEVSSELFFKDYKGPFWECFYNISGDFFTIAFLSSKSDEYKQIIPVHIFMSLDE